MQFSGKIVYHLIGELIIKSHTTSIALTRKNLITIEFQFHLKFNSTANKLIYQYQLYSN